MSEQKTIHWKEPHKIHTYEVDYTNRLTVSSIFNFMQEAAANSANHLGFGYHDLINDGLFWVLTRSKIQIHGYKHVGEEITVETWPKQIEGIVAYRDFKIYDSTGATLCLATTSWLLVDSKTMRSVKADELARRVPQFALESAINEAPAKIAEPAEKEFVYEKIIRYMDIDVNQHVNNVKYIEFILDCFPFDFFKTKEIVSLQVNFINELRFGDQLQLAKANVKLADNLYYIDGVKQGNHKVFQALVEWRN